MSDKKLFEESLLKKMARTILNRNEEISIQNCEIEKCDIAGGFQGDYFKMKILVDYQNGQESLYYFIKSLPSDEEKAKKLNEAGYFQRESNVYTKIFIEIQKVQNVVKYHPKLAAITTSDIILEDLSKTGHRMTNSRGTFDDNHCIISLRSLAKFHAGSLILEEKLTAKNGRKFRMENEYKDFLGECGYIYKGWYTAGMEASLAVAEEFGRHKDVMTVEECKSTWRKLFMRALDLCRPSKNNRNVLCHRDLWANNLMFSYNSNDKPLNCVFVDYQACRCMPLAGDVVSLIYLNLTKERRQNTFKDKIQFYYEELSKELSCHELKIESLIPWDMFLVDCDIYRLWGLVQCLMLHQLALLNPEDAELISSDANYDYMLNVSRKDFILEVTTKDSVYRERIVESIDELIESFILTGC